MKSIDFTESTGAVSLQNKVRNLHSAITRAIFDYDDRYGVQDWRDQARAIFFFLKSKGCKPLSGKSPVRINIDGETGSLYLVQFEDLDGQERWLAYEDEFGIAEITNEEPNPQSFS